MGKNDFYKVSLTTEITIYWLLVGLMRSLKSSHKESLKKPLLCEDFNDLMITSPTSNHILDIDISVSVVMTHFEN